MAQYQAEFKPEGGVIVVTFPDVGYGATQGATESEALEMAQDFLVMAIGDLVKQGKAIPKATTRRGGKYRWIKLPALASVNFHGDFFARRFDIRDASGALIHTACVAAPTDSSPAHGWHLQGGVQCTSSFLR